MASTKKRRGVSRARAWAAAVALLELGDEVVDGNADAPRAGAPVLRLRGGPGDGTWRARLWVDGAVLLGEDGAALKPRPPPDRYVIVGADGEAEEAAVSRSARSRPPTGRKRGPDKVLPEGVERRERIMFTPDDEDLVEILRIAEAHGLDKAEVVTALVRKGLRGVAVSWEG